MSWEWQEHNMAKVLAHKQQGGYEAKVTSREGALDTLAHLAMELGVLEAVSLIEVEREREGIPESMAAFRRECIKRLSEKGLIKGKVYAIDGSGIGSRWR